MNFKANEKDFLKLCLSLTAEEKKNFYTLFPTDHHANHWSYLKDLYRNAPHLFEIDVHRNISDQFNVSIKVGDIYEPRMGLSTNSRKFLMEDLVDLLDQIRQDIKHAHE